MYLHETNSILTTLEFYWLLRQLCAYKLTGLFRMSLFKRIWHRAVDDAWKWRLPWKETDKTKAKWLMMIKNGRNCIAKNTVKIQTNPTGGTKETLEELTSSVTQPQQQQFRWKPQWVSRESTTLNEHQCPLKGTAEINYPRYPRQEPQSVRVTLTDTILIY